MQLQRLADLPADPHRRIERLHGILRDIGHRARRGSRASRRSLEIEQWRRAASSMLPATMRARCGSSRRTASAVSVLPLPDSPMRPTISPGQTSSPTSSTTRVGAARRPNSMLRPSIASVGSRPSERV